MGGRTLDQFRSLQKAKAQKNSKNPSPDISDNNPERNVKNKDNPR